MSLEHPLWILVLIPLISYFLNERVIQKDHNKTRTETWPTDIETSGV